MGFFFSFLFPPPNLLQSTGTESSRTCPRGCPLLEGEEGTALLQSRWGWPQHAAGPSTPLALTTQTPASALAEGVVARVQHAPVSCLHALRWAASSWQIFKELEGMCCIPQGIMHCIITKRAQGSWASAALLQWGLIPCPAHREDKTCLPCLLLLGK